MLLGSAYCSGGGGPVHPGPDQSASTGAKAARRCATKAATSAGTAGPRAWTAPIVARHPTRRARCPASRRRGARRHHAPPSRRAAEPSRGRPAPLAAALRRWWSKGGRRPRSRAARRLWPLASDIQTGGSLSRRQPRRSCAATSPGEAGAPRRARWAGLAHRTRRPDASGTPVTAFPAGEPSRTTRSAPLPGRNPVSSIGPRSISACGWAARKPATAGATCSRQKERRAGTRNRPRGGSCRSAASRAPRRTRTGAAAAWRAGGGWCGRAGGGQFGLELLQGAGRSGGGQAEAPPGAGDGARLDRPGE